MNCDEIVSGLILEFRRGTLIMVVLAQLNKPMYGYSLVKELEGKGIPIEGNTLYPLLRRLESQGLLKSEWETDAAKPRKYYIKCFLSMIIIIFSAFTVSAVLN